MAGVEVIEIDFVSYEHGGGPGSATQTVAMDVHIPPSATAASPAPALVWWHGGGLLQGSRKGIAPHLRDAPLEHGLAVVSLDYRLAPQATICDILSDVSAGLHFLKTESFQSKTGGRVDPQRVIVCGSSAGGWLALLAGTALSFDQCRVPRPPVGLIKGIVAIYPITTLVDPFWTTKQRPVSWLEDAGTVISPEDLDGALDRSGPVLSWNAPESARTKMYPYMVQEGLLQSLLLGDLDIDPGNLSIGPLLKSGNVKSLPPTYIVHGTADDKVPVNQAVEVRDAAQHAGLHVELDVLDGKDHLYDQAEDERMEAMYRFVKRVLDAL